MAYVKATIAMTLDVYTSRSFVDCILFKNGIFYSGNISTDKCVAQFFCNSRASCCQ